MKYKIVACIPTKNEEFCIERVLKVLSLFCYKIIVNDDNSTDKTQEICKKFKNVDLLIRRKHDEMNREGSLQRQELLDKAYEYNPDYFFFIDGDEIPVPSIIDFFENIDTSINTWYLPMRDLYKDEYHYRVDKFTTKHGIRRDFSKPTTNKGFIVKNIKGYKLKYDISQHRCRPSNQPINSPPPTKLAGDNAMILHYSKLKPYFLSGKSNMDRAKWDYYSKGANIQKTLKHHEFCWDETTLKLEEIKEEWKWNWSEL